MEPRNKKSRKNQDRRVEARDLDRLSNLPDSILTHICSFLDFLTVIRTSVLSKRYKRLWTLCPCLNFKFTDYNGDKFYSKSGRVSAFESYVNRVLQLREGINLVKFRLSLHAHVWLEFAQNCVFYAAVHKVQHLRIRGYFDRKPLVLPSLLLNSPSMISLNLSNATLKSIALPKLVSLPNLKVLCLKNFEFSETNYNGELFRGCPNLETLVLCKCSIMPVNRLKVLDVNCLNLKHFEIKRWRSPWRCFDEHRINLNAPNLVSLKFQGHLVRMSFNEVLPCLERAFFDLFFPTACVTINGSERKEKTSECFLNMLLNVCNVKVISLSLRTIEVMCFCRDLRIHAPLSFENLRIINFTVDNKIGEKTIPIAKINRLLENIGTDVLIFDGHKVKKVPPESSNDKSKRNNRHITIPAHSLQFWLESSPAAEFLSIEIPNLSSDG